MKNWNKLSTKLPKINKVVFILNKDKNVIDKGKLQIYTKSNDKISDPDRRMKEGDIYWERYSLTDNKNT